MKGATHLTAAVMQVTPQVAKEILRRGPPANVEWKRNRKATNSQIEKLKAKMDNGLWILAQPIMFDNEGKLLDGQHRMLAVIQHGKPVDFIAIDGFENITFGQIDETVTRGIADWLHIKGEDLPKELSSLLRYVWLDSNDLLPTRSGGFGSRGWTIQAAIKILDEHPELRDALRAPGVTSNGLVSRSLGAFLWWKFSKTDKAAANEFFTDLIYARNQISETDPMCILRYWLETNKESRKKEPMTVVAAVTIKAWNAIRKQEPCRQLKFNKNEKFPQVI